MYVIIQWHKRRARDGARADLLFLRPAHSAVDLMMCAYWLNYQSIVYLCSGAGARQRARAAGEKQKSPYGSAEVQIKTNDLIVRRSVEER